MIKACGGAGYDSGKSILMKNISKKMLANPVSKKSLSSKNN